MVERILERRVSFLGAWKTGKLSERLIADISRHAERFQGSPSTLQLTKLGFKLHVKSGSGQVESTDFIPVQNVYELSVNKYKPTCLMCLMVDGTKGMSILVWKCLSERDSFEIIKAFTFLKHSLGGEGEGYNVHLRKSHGNNWSLGRKEGGRVGNKGGKEENPYTSIKAARKAMENKVVVRSVPDGVRSLTDKETQTDNDDDLLSASFSHESSSLKDELNDLSDEVNAVKNMLETYIGISGPTHHKREVKQNGQDVVLRNVEPTVTKGTYVRAKSSYVANGVDSGVNGDVVDAQLIDDYDIRSTGIQTEQKRQSNYLEVDDNVQYRPKEVSSGPHANYLRASTSGSRQETKQRLSSDTSEGSDGVFLQYRKPWAYDDQNKGGKLITFITPPPERNSGTGDIPRRTTERRYVKKDNMRNSVVVNSLPRNSGGPPVWKSTIPRSIENVYPTNRRYPRDRRSRIVVHPDMFVRDNVDRKRSSSAHDTNRKRLDEETWRQSMQVRRSSMEEIRM